LEAVVDVLRVGFVGVRTPHAEATATFFRDLFGLEALKDDPTWSILRLPTGRFDFFEVYGAQFDDERLAPPDQPIFVAFTVADLRDAHREITAAGRLVGDIVWADEAFGDPDLTGYGWFFFRAPDDLTYVVQQVPE
jgi:catechol 2,3-dioxygenase-like lactoylglutathione lyase family enzyme